MRCNFITTGSLLLLISAISPSYAEDNCKNDKQCLKFEKLSDFGHDQKIIDRVRPSKEYSKGSRFYIGLAYSVRANEVTSTELRVHYLQQAIKYGDYSAYVNLYQFYRNKDASKALRILEDYVATKPEDSDAYFLLGENYYEKGQNKLAYQMLMESKKYSTGHSTGLDFYLFQLSYLRNEFKQAEQFLLSALAQGRLIESRKKMLLDPRFKGIQNHSIFKNYFSDSK